MTDETKPTHGALGGPKAKAGKNRRLPAVRGWEWNAVREHAAQLVADGELSGVEIGRRLHVSDRTIDTWKQAPEFRARVEEHLARYRERFLQEGLADKARRIAEITKLYYLLEVEIEFRAADFRRRGLKHDSTGLVSEKVKQIGSGEFAERISEFTIDTAVVGLMASLLKQIAEELGQYNRPFEADVNPAVGVAAPAAKQPSPIDLDALSIDELNELERLVRKATINAARTLPH